MRFGMRKPCWGWNDPATEEVRMALCYAVPRTGARLPEQGRRSDGTAPGFRAPFINTPSRSPEGSRNTKSNLRSRESLSERASQPGVHPKPSHLLNALLRYKRTLRLCSSCILKSHTSQRFPWEGKHAGLVFLLDVAKKGRSSFSFLCHEICLFAFFTEPRFLLSRTAGWKPFMF